MVNDYYVEDNSSTVMAKSKSLFISCKTFNNELTEVEFRRNLDFAWRFIHEYKGGKSKKVNKATEVSKVVDHEPCECGSTFFIQTGTCFCCQLCGSSGGCS